jgi:hypothetical protein
MLRTLGHSIRAPELEETNHREKPQKPRGKVRPQYLVCICLPDDFDPSTVAEAMMEEIHALNREMIAASLRKL